MKTILMSTTETVDPIFIFIFGASLILLLGITAVMIWFVFRYHRSRSPQPTSVTDGNLTLEIVWIVLPTILVMAMFYYGWAGYLSLRNVPPGSMEVKATARMWSWNFAYPGGRSSSKLYVPVGKPVKVSLASVDVLHGFYIPAFRVKRDVVPGMSNNVWFVANKPGSYDIFCSSYCGTGHSAMITTVEAIPEAEFAAWLKEQASAGPPHPGLALLEKHGCLGCHSTDGSAKIGPTFKGIWGRQTVVLTGGSERNITVDEPYLKKAIAEPNADVVKGFAPAMPPYQLEVGELNTVIDYFKTGGASKAALAIDGKTVAQEKGCLACHSVDGSKGVGPTLKGLAGSQVKVLKNGKPMTVTADAAFLKESIADPGATVVDGYQPIMPPFADLSEAEMNALLKWMGELK